VHDNFIANWLDPAAADLLPEKFLGKDIREMSVEEYVYWVGLLQGEGFREYIDNFRRRMFDCASAIFWMYNDCWPTVRSWTIVDYYLRRTPAFHPVRRAFAPVSVVVTKDGNEVDVWGVNDTTEPVDADLRYGVFAIAGGYPVDRTARARLAPNASTKLASFPAGEWKDPSSSAAFAVLTRGGELLAKNRLFLPFYKDLKWAPAKVAVKLSGGKAVFESASFAFGVCLDLDGEKQLPDNFFDIFPGVPHSIPWPGSEPPKVLHVGNLA
jgi:beta-mannosidase